MSGLSDSVFEELTAEIFGEPAAEPSPVEPESPEANAQIDPETTTSDTTDEILSTEPEPEPEPDPTESRLAELEQREQELTRREQEQTEQRNRVIAQWQAWQDQQAEQRAEAYYQQLADEHGQEIADQYKTLRTTDLQRRKEAEQRANGAEHGLTAAMIALEHTDPEVFQRVLAMTERLVQYPDPVQMQQAILSEQEQANQQNAKIVELEQVVRELRSKIEAQARPAAADVVDGAPAGPATGLRPEDAPDFDGFFERLFA